MRSRKLPGWLGLAAGTGIVLAVAGTAAATSNREAGPSGIRAAGACMLHTFNMDLSNPATVVIDFYRQGGGGSVPINLPPVLAQGNYALDLTQPSRLATGAYAAFVSADRVIGNLAHCRWQASGGAVMSNAAVPGADVVVPGIVKAVEPGSQSSLVSIQNTDPNQPASVTVRLFLTGNSIAILVKSYTIAKGTSITLDTATDPSFDLVPAGFTGWLRVESATPLAVNAITDYGTVDKAVTEVEGVPVDQAADTLLAPLVAHDAPMNPKDAASALLNSQIDVVNPGANPVSATVEYTGVAGACLGQTFLDGPQVVEAQRGVTFAQTGGALPAGCRAIARVQSIGGKLIATVQVAGGPAGAPQLAAAYGALPSTAAATVTHLPFLRHKKSGNTSAVWVMNAGTTATDVQLELAFDGSNPGSVPCTGCTVNVPAGGGHLWWLGDVAEFGAGRFGFGTLRAAQPLAAVVLDLPEGAGGDDLAAYVGLNGVSVGPSGMPGVQCLPLLLQLNLAPATATPFLPPATATRPPVPTPTPFATSTLDPTETPPATDTALPSPTVVPSQTALPTDTPVATDLPTPLPSATPLVQRVARELAAKVPPAVLDDALAHPERIDGWQQPLDPGKPVGPFNPVRTCLTLRNPGQAWHPFFNTLVFKAGCP